MLPQTVEAERLLKDSIDLHVHCGPECIPRKLDAFSLANALKEYGMQTAVMKSHFQPTSDWAYLAQKYALVKLYGSITLNHSVGGVNPYAIKAALGPKINGKALLKIVWMPTIHAKAHLESFKAKGCMYDIPPEWTGGKVLESAERIDQIKPITLSDPSVRKNLGKVLNLIVDNDLILATGHLSAQEVMQLVDEAKSSGVRKIIATHPIYQTTRMTIEQAKELAGKGVHLEQTYALHLIDKIPIDQMADFIRDVGPSHCIITSDLGQVGTPLPPEGLITFMKELIDRGISIAEIQTMVKHNPQSLLGV